MARRYKSSMSKMFLQLPKSKGMPILHRKNVSPNILRNCNKSLDILDFYLLSLAAGLYTWYVQKHWFTTNQNFVTMFYLHLHAGMDWKFYRQCWNWIELVFLQNAFRQTDTQVARFWNQNHSVFWLTRNHCLWGLALWAFTSEHSLYFYRPRSEGYNVLGNVRPSVRLYVRALLFEPFVCVSTNRAEESLSVQDVCLCVD